MERGVPIRSISRSIAVLQAINRQGSLSLMEVARSAGLPYPTACRIIQTLMHEGLIECEPMRKRYRATALVQSLSAGFRDSGRLLAEARPRIVELTRQIGWPISVATHVGASMMVRDSTHTLTSLTFNNYAPGYTVPILESASGHAYLAYADDMERQTIMETLEQLEGPSDMLAMFKSGLLVRRIREDGFATRDRNVHTANPGKTSSISVPVFDQGRVVAALTLVFFATAMPMAEAVRRHGDALKSCALDIAAALCGNVVEDAAPVATDSHLSLVA